MSSAEEGLSSALSANVLLLEKELQNFHSAVVGRSAVVLVAFASDRNIGACKEARKSRRGRRRKRMAMNEDAHQPQTWKCHCLGRDAQQTANSSTRARKGAPRTVTIPGRTSVHGHTHG